ncbi:MAG: hypothetical protein ABC596_08825 [Candidatus Methanosuratincola petrocarbonis]
MPWGTNYKAVPFITATDQIIFCWARAADAVARYKLVNMVAEKKRACQAMKDFFLMAYPALAAKKRYLHWGEWYSNTDIDSLEPKELQLKFIEFCTDLVRAKVLPMDTKKPIAKGGITIEDLEEPEMEGGE